MTNNAITIKDLNVHIGYFSLRDINLTVEKGTIMGFIGKNGAGKTTLIKSILDVIKPHSGEVLFNGIPLEGNEEIVKEKIAVVYDSLIYPTYLNPKKLINMITPFYASFDIAKFRKLMLRFGLSEDVKLANLSKGMQMKFSIVMALAQNPDILILDEPTAGLDPSARAEALDLLLNFMQEENKTVFFSTHITSDLDKIADYITLIDNGKIIFSEDKEKLLDKYALVQIEKEVITEQMKQNLTGLKENVFGFEGLCSDKAMFSGIEGVKTARPTVEDIMIFRGGLNGN